MAIGYADCSRIGIVSAFVWSCVSANAQRLSSPVAFYLRLRSLSLGKRSLAGCVVAPAVMELSMVRGAEPLTQHKR